jgi:hypothetical protein
VHEADGAECLAFGDPRSEGLSWSGGEHVLARALKERQPLVVRDVGLGVGRVEAGDGEPLEDTVVERRIPERGAAHGQRADFDVRELEVDVGVLDACDGGTPGVDVGELDDQERSQ